MIDYTAVRREIEVYLNSEFETVPIVFENTDLSSRSIPHVSLVDTDISSNRTGFNEDSYIVTGRLTFNIFSQKGVGTEGARDIASEIITLLEDFNGNIVFQEFIFQSVGLVDEGHLYRHILSVPYSYVYGQND